MYKYYLTLLLILPGCGYNKPPKAEYEIWFDEHVTNMQRSAVLDAMDEWTTTTDGMARFYITENPNDAGPVIKILTFEPTNSRGGTCWHYPDKNESIEIANGYSLETTRRIALHELGHCLGLPHDIEGTVMYKTVGPQQAEHLTCKDITAFCRMWNCFPTEFAACQ